MNFDSALFGFGFSALFFNSIYVCCCALIKNDTFLEASILSSKHFIDYGSK